MLALFLIQQVDLDLDQKSLIIALTDLNFRSNSKYSHIHMIENFKLGSIS